MRGGCSCPLGSADGWRSAHCACRRSPYFNGQYAIREIGYLTDDVSAAHPEAPYACLGCQEQGMCSCGKPRCPEPECGLCAWHADDRGCAECWRTHGGPGHGYCEEHGMVPVHAHPTGGQCDVDDAGYCYHASNLTRYMPRKCTKTTHMHCPYCVVETYLWNCRFGLRTPPLCVECRRLVDDDRVAYAASRWEAA